MRTSATQLDFLSATPPKPRVMSAQCRRIVDLFERNRFTVDGRDSREWFTLREIVANCGGMGEATASARLRDLRRKWGYGVDARLRGNSRNLAEYRVHDGPGSFRQGVRR